MLYSIRLFYGVGGDKFKKINSKKKNHKCRRDVAFWDISLAETGWDLLSICKIIDLLLKELSRFKSMQMGARVAPPSPVG